MSAFIKGNIFSEPPATDQPEYFESLVKTKDILIERIVTTEKFKAPGPWFDQECDEWVLLISGEAQLEFEDNKTVSMKKGDFIMIKAHQRHRVLWASIEPNSLWLAVHGDLK